MWRAAEAALRGGVGGGDMRDEHTDTFFLGKKGGDRGKKRSEEEERRGDGAGRA